MKGYGATLCNTKAYEVNKLVSIAELALIEGDYNSENESPTAAFFDYKNMWRNKNGEEINIGLDISRATGVWFKKADVKL